MKATPEELKALQKTIKLLWGSQRACAIEIGVHETSLSDTVRGIYPIPGDLLIFIARKGGSVDAIFQNGVSRDIESVLEYCSAHLTNDDVIELLRLRMGLK